MFGGQARQHSSEMVHWKLRATLARSMPNAPEHTHCHEDNSPMMEISRLLGESNNACCSCTEQNVSTHWSGVDVLDDVFLAACRAGGSTARAASGGSEAPGGAGQSSVRFSPHLALRGLYWFCRYPVRSVWQLRGCCSALHKVQLLTPYTLARSVTLHKLEAAEGCWSV